MEGDISLNCTIQIASTHSGIELIEKLCHFPDILFTCPLRGQTGGKRFERGTDLKQLQELFLVLFHPTTPPHGQAGECGAIGYEGSQPLAYLKDPLGLEEADCLS